MPRGGISKGHPKDVLIRKLARICYIDVDIHCTEPLKSRLKMLIADARYWCGIKKKRKE